MKSAVDLKIGKVFVYRDEPCKVVDYKHTHMGRGSADVRLKIKGLVSGNVISVTFAPDARFEEANLAKKPMQFLYESDGVLFFMDPVTFNQVELNKNELSESVMFLKDGETYDVLYWDDEALDVLVPPKVTLKVIECDPGVKGNSAANMYKSAVVTGNISLKVPLFIKQGELIRIDTVNCKYVERAKE